MKKKESEVNWKKKGRKTWSVVKKDFCNINCIYLQLDNDNISLPFSFNEIFNFEVRRYSLQRFVLFLKQQ